MDLYNDVTKLYRSRRADKVKLANEAVKSATEQAQKEGRPITGYRSYNYGVYSGKGQMRNYTAQIPIFGQTTEERLAPIRTAQAEAQQLFETQRDDIAEQLKIVQDERGAVSRMQEDYSNMLIREAEAKRRAEEERRISLQTSRANAARSNVGSNLQIKFGGGVKPFSGGSTPRSSGTGQFKRRLNIGQSNMVNV